MYINTICNNPKYTDSKRNIQQSPTFTGNISTNTVDTITVKAFTNPKVKKAYSTFFKIFSKEKQANIPYSFTSCVNADGSVDNYAMKMLIALYQGKSPDLVEYIKSLFSKKKTYSILDVDKNYGNALKLVADIIEACKDKNKNQNKENLQFAKNIYLHSNVLRDDIPAIITSLKNQEGICTPENIEFYNILCTNYHPSRLSILLPKMENKDGIITDSAKNFVLNFNSILTSSHEREGRKSFLDDILSNNNSAKRDEIFDFLSNSEFIKKNCPSLSLYRDETGNINLDYLKKYMQIQNEMNDRFKIPANIYQSDNPEITDKNIEQAKRLNSYVRSPYGCYESYNASIDVFSKSKYFKKDGIINKEYIDFIIYNDYMFRNPDRSNAYATIEPSIDYAIDKDGKINWDVADILLNFGYKYSQQMKTYDKHKITTMLRQAGELCKDNSGNFSEENIIEARRDLDFIKKEFYRYSDVAEGKGEKYLAKQYLLHIIKNKNLYDAAEMLKILEKGDLTNMLVQTKIPEYENLLLTIADIAPENNIEAYKKIMQKLLEISNLDFNIKDSHGISFLEKVMNSENILLLKLITHPSMKKLLYTEELDFTYKGIQNEEFKKQIDNELKIKFPLMEEAVKCYSQKAWEKVEHQLESPLCHKEEVLKDLWDMAINTKNYEFCKYFADKYSNELPSSIINDLDNLASRR